MKKTAKALAIVLTLAICLASLAACAGRGKNPAKITDPREKISYALKKVDEFLAAAGGARAAATEWKPGLKTKDYFDSAEKYSAYLSEPDGVPEIADLLRGGRRDDDGFAYDEPPMIQFRYLKAVYDRYDNKEFDLGKRYSGETTGAVSIDGFGRKDESPSATRYDYRFDLSMALDIDDRDVITADASFLIELENGGQKHVMKQYVKMVLLFDFKDKGGDYSLLMNYVTDETDLPWSDIDYGYEHDYAEGDASALAKWRKLGYKSDRAVNWVSDLDGAEYDLTVAKMLLDGIVFNGRTESDTFPDRETIARILCGKLGLNAFEMDASAFLAGPGKNSPAMVSVYEDMCREYGDDLVYDLVDPKIMPRQDGDDHGPDEGNPDDPGSHSDYETDVTTEETENGIRKTYATKTGTYVFEIPSDGESVTVTAPEWGEHKPRTLYKDGESGESYSAEFNDHVLRAVFEENSVVTLSHCRKDGTGMRRMIVHGNGWCEYPDDGNEDVVHDPFRDEHQGEGFAFDPPAGSCITTEQLDRGMKITYAAENGKDYVFEVFDNGDGTMTMAASVPDWGEKPMKLREAGEKCFAERLGEYDYVVSVNPDYSVILERTGKEPQIGIVIYADGTVETPEEGCKPLPDEGNPDEGNPVEPTAESRITVEKIENGTRTTYDTERGIHVFDVVSTESGMKMIATVPDWGDNPLELEQTNEKGLFVKDTEGCLYRVELGPDRSVTLAWGQEGSMNTIVLHEDGTVSAS